MVSPPEYPPERLSRPIFYPAAEKLRFHSAHRIPHSVIVSILRPRKLSPARVFTCRVYTHYGPVSKFSSTSFCVGPAFGSWKHDTLVAGGFPFVPSPNSVHVASTLHGRDEPLSGCVHRGREPSMRWRRQGLVHVYAGAATDVFGVLQSIAKRCHFPCACRSENASHIMGIQR